MLCNVTFNAYIFADIFSDIAIKLTPFFIAIKILFSFSIFLSDILKFNFLTYFFKSFEDKYYLLNYRHNTKFFHLCLNATEKSLFKRTWFRTYIAKQILILALSDVYVFTVNRMGINLYVIDILQINV